MKKFLLVMCLLYFSTVCFAFDIDKWNEYTKLRYSECSAGDIECTNRVHKELMQELDVYERNAYIMMQQHQADLMLHSLTEPRRIKYGYNSMGEYVPIEY